MSQPAQIHEVDQIHKLREALARLKLQADGALGAAQMEIQRGTQAVDNLLTRWQAEVRRSEDEVARARHDLGFHRSLYEGQHVGETELQVRLKKAQQHLCEAEEKVKSARRWQRLLPQAIHDYEGPARALSGFLDTELRKALAVLESKTAALEAYIALTVGDSGRPAPPAKVTAAPAADNAAG